MTMTHTYTQTGIETDWVRLELIDPISNNAKFYIVWRRPGGSAWLAAFGRIGAKPQWTANVGAPSVQINSKTKKGYTEVARGTVTVPESWMPAFHTGSSDATTASLRKGIFDATFAETHVVDRERPLADLLEETSKLVSESVANPDRAMHTFAGMIGRFEAAKEDCETIEGLVETIRLLLGKGEA